MLFNRTKLIYLLFLLSSVNIQFEIFMCLKIVALTSKGLTQIRT